MLRPNQVTNKGCAVSFIHKPCSSDLCNDYKASHKWGGGGEAKLCKIETAFRFLFCRQDESNVIAGKVNSASHSYQISTECKEMLRSRYFSNDPRNTQSYTLMSAEIL